MVRVKVLIVDDEPEVLELIAEMIAAIGHEPVLADDGRRAWGVFSSDSVRVVITDWSMPGMDGLELVRRIRGAKRVRYTYVIVLTAFGGPDAYLEGMEAGADDFVTKPVSPDELRVRLRVAERILGLQDDVKLLEGLISICMYCKRVDVAENDWTTIERYVEERSDASFSHGICPACYTTHVQPDLDRLSKPEQAPERSDEPPGR